MVHTLDRQNQTNQTKPNQTKFATSLKEKNSLPSHINKTLGKR
jgi:hypothetical protein